MKRFLETSLSLKKHAKTAILAKATAESVDLGDSELPADKEQLDALIARRCEEALKHQLGAALDKRLKKEGAKKFTRGTPSASRKKKTGRSGQKSKENTPTKASTTKAKQTRPTRSRAANNAEKQKKRSKQKKSNSGKPSNKKNIKSNKKQQK